MSHMHKNSASLGLVFLAFVVLAGTVRAGETKHPPFPDVWGRVLPVPQTSIPTMRGSDIFHNPDGDRLIQFGYDNPIFV